ncbi:unnamed protein product, partial [Trichogramma brassicae]
MVRLLLKYGADPNLTGNDAAMTPLHRLSLRLFDNELLDDSIVNVRSDLVEMIFEDCHDKCFPAIFSVKLKIFEKSDPIVVKLREFPIKMM